MGEDAAGASFVPLLQAYRATYSKIQLESNSLYTFECSRWNAALGKRTGATDSLEQTKRTKERKNMP